MSALRLHTLHEASDIQDVSWNNSDAAAWSSVEVNVAIGCACVATLRPLVILVPQRLRGFARSAALISRQRGAPARQRGDYELSTFKLGKEGPVGVRTAATIQRMRGLGEDSLHEGSYSFKTYVYRHNAKFLELSNQKGVPGGKRSLIYERGNADDTGSLIQGRIKVVTHISQDVESKESGSGSGSGSEVSNARMKSTEYV